jgi:hypothetical protein
VQQLRHSVKWCERRLIPCYVVHERSGNAKMAKQAQSKEKILDKMLKSGLTEKV